MNALTRARNSRKNELHENEVPISFMIWQTAEMGRDKSKTKKPFKIDDFYVYDDASTADSVDSIYGAAALALVEAKKFPSWALFAWTELKKNADKCDPPAVLSYQSDDCLLLAPREVKGRLKGLLVAKQKVSGMLHVLRTGPKTGIMVKIPELEGEVSVIENCYLEIKVMELGL